MRKNLFIWIVSAISGLTLAAMAGQSRQSDDAKRHKVLEFDGHRVEALGRRPLDSLSEIADKDRNRRRKHLYEKRKDFHPETSETLNEMRHGL